MIKILSMFLVLAALVFSGMFLGALAVSPDSKDIVAPMGTFLMLVFLGGIGARELLGEGVEI